jgi:hypothetical protein
MRSPISWSMFFLARTVDLAQPRAHRLGDLVERTTDLRPEVGVPELPKLEPVRAQRLHGDDRGVLEASIFGALLATSFHQPLSAGVNASASGLEPAVGTSFCVARQNSTGSAGASTGVSVERRSIPA